MVEKTWMEIPDHYPGVEIDEFIVMPNHIHGIIILNGENGRPRGAAPTGKSLRTTPLSLPDVIHRYKSLTTARYRHHVESDHWPRFHGRFWQRSFYDHVIRNEKSLDQI